MTQKQSVQILSTNIFTTAVPFSVVDPYWDKKLDPDTAFYLNADPELDLDLYGAEPIPVHTDPDPGQTLVTQKFNFYMKNIYLK